MSAGDVLCEVHCFVREQVCLCILGELAVFCWGSFVGGAGCSPGALGSGCTCPPCLRAQPMPATPPPRLQEGTVTAGLPGNGGGAAGKPGQPCTNCLCMSSGSHPGSLLCTFPLATAALLGWLQRLGCSCRNGNALTCPVLLCLFLPLAPAGVWGAEEARDLRAQREAGGRPAPNHGCTCQCQPASSTTGALGCLLPLTVPPCHQAWRSTPALVFCQEPHQPQPPLLSACPWPLQAQQRKAHEAQGRVRLLDGRLLEAQEEVARLNSKVGGWEGSSHGASRMPRPSAAMRGWGVVQRAAQLRQPAGP